MTKFQVGKRYQTLNNNGRSFECRGIVDNTPVLLDGHYLFVPPFPESLIEVKEPETASDAPERNHPRRASRPRKDQRRP